MPDSSLRRCCLGQLGRQGIACRVEATHGLQGEGGVADVDQLGVLVGLVDDRGAGAVEDDLAGGGGGDPVGAAYREDPAGDDQRFVVGQDDLVGGALAVAGEADDHRRGRGVVGVAHDHLHVLLLVPGGDVVGGEVLDPCWGLGHG
jgi:hypothetical protein